MQKTICLLVSCFILFTSISAQYHLDVEGHAIIQGKLDFSHAYDTTSIYVGKSAGKSIDSAGYVTNRLNTALGYQAYETSSGGTFNTVVGSRSGTNLYGSFNAFFGYGAGRHATGQNNSFFGANSGSINDDGSQNAFFGISSGHSNLEGSANTFLGAYAGGDNENADFNTYVGYSSGHQVSGDTSALNTFVGANAGQVKIGGKENVLVGGEAGLKNREGDFNTLIGVRAGAGDNATRMDYCTFVGYESGEDHQAGPSTFLGAFSGTNNLSGEQNTFIGTSSGLSNVDGHENTFVGYTSGFNNSSGHRNTFIGMDAGREITAGTDNICLGRRAGPTADVSGRLYIDVVQTDEPLIFGDFGSDQLKVYGQVQTEADQAILQMHTRSHANGSVLVLQSAATTPTYWGAINFNNGLGDTRGQIGYRGSNEMTLRVDGIDPFMTLSNGGDHIVMSNGATLTSGGVWTNNCSEALKNLEINLDGKSILKKIENLPLYQWSYKKNGERHAGPTAEDFHNIFDLGSSHTRLAAIDLAGVALAAIQELTKQNRALKDALVEQNRLHMEQLSILKAKISSIETREIIRVRSTDESTDIF